MDSAAVFAEFSIFHFGGFMKLYTSQDLSQMSRYIRICIPNHLPFIIDIKSHCILNWEIGFEAMTIYENEWNSKFHYHYDASNSTLIMEIQDVTFNYEWLLHIGAFTKTNSSDFLTSLKETALSESAETIISLLLNRPKSSLKIGNKKIEPLVAVITFGL